MGYMHWTNTLCPQVTDTYFGDNLMKVGKAGVILSVTAGYPTATMVARLSVEQLVPQWKRSPSCPRAAAIATVVLAISATTALFVDDLGVIVEVSYTRNDELWVLNDEICIKNDEIGI